MELNTEKHLTKIFHFLRKSFTEMGYEHLKKGNEHLKNGVEHLKISLILTLNFSYFTKLFKQSSFVPRHTNVQRHISFEFDGWKYVSVPIGGHSILKF